MKVEDKKGIIESLLKSSGRELLLKEIEGMIEDRRVLLETVNPTNKEVIYDGYDLLRMDIDNLNTLKSLPDSILKKETKSITVDNSKEL